MTATSISVKAWRPFKTADGLQYKIDATFSADDTDNTVSAATMQMDDIGRVETGKRVRTFKAQLEVCAIDRSPSLVFHYGDPQKTGVTPDPSITIPGTVVDGFWLREDDAVKQVLAKSALEQGISDECRRVLQPALNSVAEKACGAVKQVKFEEISQAKKSGLLTRRTSEFHIDYREFRKDFLKRFIQCARPGIRQITYCLGRHAASLDHEWTKFLENFGAPLAVTHEDRDSNKWFRRLKNLQEFGLFNHHEKVDWKKIDQTTKGGYRLSRFIENSIEAPEIGLKRLIDTYEILTPKSTEESWRISSMLRLLYYYVASLKQSRK